MHKNLRVFEKLVGAQNYSNVILVTSKWDRLDSVEEGEAREKDLRENFWAPLIEQGSLCARFSGDKASALQIIEHIAFDQRVSTKPPLHIQTEVVDEQKTLDETAAGAVLRQELSDMQRKI